MALCVIKNAKTGGDGYLQICPISIKLKLLEYQPILKNFLLCFSLLCSFFVSSAHSEAYFQFDSFEHYIASALHGQALTDFKEVTAKVKNNIFWKTRSNKNKYQSAYRRSMPQFKNFFRDDVPDFVFLIPYLESAWRPTKGRKKSDYGYWQMVSEVVAEIKTLDHASKALKKAHPDKIRSDPSLSTEAAVIHLKRYYFYFRHVANFSEADAWLFSVTAYNWGAGNIKRILLKMLREGVVKDESALQFSNFYHYLYQSSKSNSADRSMRVALEYLPNLWNISLLIRKYQEQKYSKQSLKNKHHIKHKG